MFNASSKCGMTFRDPTYVANGAWKECSEMRNARSAANGGPVVITSGKNETGYIRMVYTIRSPPGVSGRLGPLYFPNSSQH